MFITACGPPSRTSTSASFLVPVFVSGHSVSSCSKNAWPFHQPSLSISVETLSPLVNRSAGFCLVGTCLHCTGSVNDCISSTRFATKGLNFRLQPRMQYNTSTLSEQNNYSCLGRFRTFLTASIETAWVRWCIFLWRRTFGMENNEF